VEIITNLPLSMAQAMTTMATGEPGNKTSMPRMLKYAGAPASYRQPV
jgi:hypothetical protein